MIIGNLEDKVASCYTEDTPQYSDFLTLEEISEAEELLSNSGIFYTFWGGYPNAERKIAAMFTEETEFEFPYKILCGQWDRFGEIGHRDVLGAVMSTGIERRCIGDIIIDKEERKFYLFVMQRMANYLMQNIDSIGRCSVRWCEVFEADELPIDSGKESRVSVCSLRIDAVISAVFHLSRQQALDMISTHKVFADHKEVSKPTVLLREGCNIVLRGYGKFIFLGQDGFSKKGKTYILIKQFN